MRLAASFLVSALALGLGTVPGTANSEAAQASPRKFTPPRGEFVMSRTVIRLLSDGKQIVVKRSYRVQFVPEGDGFRLDGILIGVEIDVPPMLASLADIERKRVDSGLFPIVLGGDGTIRNQDSNSIDHAARQVAAAQGGNYFGQQETDPQLRDEGIKLINNIAASNPNSPWPADLFYAKAGERRLARQVTLADGSEGTVEVLILVAGPLPCGLPQSVERVVTTQLAGTKRVSREVFTFVVPGS